MADERLKYLTGRFTLDTTDLDRAKKKTAEVKDELDKIGKDSSGSASPESRFARIKTAAEDVAKVGDKLSIGVTLPLVGLGVAARNAAGDFETTFTRMETLAGVANTEVEGLKDTVKNLASETGRGPQELADALYFIRSAGLEGATAVDALTASAKAAAIGLGSTEQVADALTSVISAYGEANITAAEAADVLVKTAREGKAEAAELAPQFGRLLPVATNLGISFDQVGAGLAFLTRQSGDASLASTQLGGIMNALLKPSEQAKDLLEGVGLSSAGIRKQIRDEGLLATLQTLSDKFKGNSEALGAVFADVQGLQGALALTGASAGDAREVFANLKTGTDELGTAFGKVADDGAFKQKQALAEVQTALIDLGTGLAPIATKVAGFAADVAGAFSKLPEGMQTATVAVGIFLAALGPVLSIGGRVTSAFDSVKGAATSLGNAFKRTGDDAVGAAGGLASTTAAIGPAGLAIAGVTVAVGVASLVYGTWKKRKEELKQATDNLRGALDDETASVEGSSRAAVESTLKQRGVVDELARAGITYDLVNRAVIGSTEAQQEYRRRLVESGEVTLELTFVGQAQKENLDQLREAFIRTGKEGPFAIVRSGEKLIDVMGLLGRSMEEVATETLDQAVAAGELTKSQADAALGTLTLADGTTDYAAVLEFARAALIKQKAATDDVTGATDGGLKAIEDAILGAKEQAAAAQEVADAERDRAKALRDSYNAVLEGANEQIAYERAQIRTEEALGKVNEAQEKVNKGGKDGERAQKDLSSALLDARDALIGQAVAAAEADANNRGLKSAADDAAGSLKVQIEQLSGVRDTLAPDSPLRAYLDQYIAKLQGEIPKQVETEIQAKYRVFIESTFGENSKFAQVNRRVGGPVPGPRDAPVAATVHGGEFVLSADVVDAVKRGAPTLGLGQRLGTAGGAPVASGGGATVIENHYHQNVVGSPVMVDADYMAEVFNRMVAMAGG